MLSQKTKLWLAGHMKTAQELAKNFTEMALMEREIFQTTPIVTICAFCKREKTGDDTWGEVYEGNARLSHGLCRRCCIDHYGFDPLDDDDENEQQTKEE